MPKKKTIQKPKPALTFEELKALPNVPEIPQHFKEDLWRMVKVSVEVKVTEETEHFLGMLCLHFGLPKNDIVTHAINLLWKEAVHTVTPERLRLYEEKLEAMRLYRLHQKEAQIVRKAERLENAMKEWKDENPQGRHRSYGECITWTYRHDKPVGRKPYWMLAKMKKKNENEDGEE